jgi:hypothetical protein
LKMHARWLIFGGIIIAFVSLFPTIAGLLNCAVKNGVHLRLDKAEYTVEEKPVLKIINCSPNRFTFGHAYSMEKMIDEEWVEVPAIRRNEEWAWLAWLRVLPPGGVYRQLIDLSGFDPGEYRVCKTIKEEATENSRTLKTGFKVIQ